MGDVAAAGAAADDSAGEASVPSGAVAAAFVVTAAIIALGGAAVISLVETLGMVALGESVHCERDECGRGLTLVKRCQFLYRSSIVGHEIHRPNNIFG